ncbi:hypothetical protein [Aeoliella mucimassa]|uniref:Uncharacterized protein n=1 Tax=Aeoliella mucimassa TaxID=2527972 RepID=A0A518AT74_9BACT|nr:hypothetical protein [Aeoliella mucimassa]QDU57925.1 hypothetical protein Pan181_41480 [Aeoliella mucimassa]
MNNTSSKQLVFVGDVGRGEAAGEVFQEWHPSLDVLRMSGTIDFDRWVEAADLIESFTRPTFIVFDSATQATQGFAFARQEIDWLRDLRKLPVGLLLRNGSGYGLELATLADVVFIVPESTVGMTAARTLDAELATGWRWHDAQVPGPGVGWQVSRERLLWLRDNRIGAELAESLFGLLLSRDEAFAFETFTEVTRGNSQ